MKLLFSTDQIVFISTFKTFAMYNHLTDSTTLTITYMAVSMVINIFTALP